MASPAFQFYPGDFVTGTIHMTAEEVGGYMLLLCCQWEQGALPADTASLRRIARCSARAMATIRQKFIEGDDGLLRNERMERVRQGLIEFSDSQRQRAKARWNKPKAMPKDATAMPPHQSGIDPASTPAMPNACSSVFSLQSSKKTDRQTDTRARGGGDDGQPDRSLLLDAFARLLNKPQTAINWGPIITWLETVDGDGQTALAWKCLQNALESSTAAPHTSQAAVKYVSAIYERCRHHECLPGEFPSGDSGGSSGNLTSRAQANVARLLAESASESAVKS